jgi:AcrR family transcriptional regulator
MSSAAHDSDANGTRRDEILDTAAEVFASFGVRVSLKEIAEACGILPGSLYHHFESKDAILVELVERYQADLSELARRIRADLRRSKGPSPRELLIDSATAMAACGKRHRAALQLTLFDPPSGSSDALVEVLAPRTSAIERAVRDVVQAGQQLGQIRASIDSGAFSDRLCQSMLTLGAVPAEAPGSDRIASMKAQILLDGLAVGMPSDHQLDRSSAFRAASAVISSWQSDAGDGDEEEDERWAALRVAARAEFGRRGYEATTIRDIAAAAGTSTGTVYRLVGSKYELLLSVMQSLAGHITDGWEAVLRSDSSVVEKLDALAWLDINVVSQFRDEYRIQLSSLQVSPPETAEQGWAFSRRMREARSLLVLGAKQRDIQLPDGTDDERAWCVLELVWMPENLASAGARPALALSRDTVIRGAGTRA